MLVVDAQQIIQIHKYIQKEIHTFLTPYVLEMRSKKIVNFNKVKQFIEEDSLFYPAIQSKINSIIDSVHVMYSITSYYSSPTFHPNLLRFDNSVVKKEVQDYLNIHVYKDVSCDFDALYLSSLARSIINTELKYHGIIYSCGIRISQDKLPLCDYCIKNYSYDLLREDHGYTKQYFTAECEDILKEKYFANQTIDKNIIGWGCLYDNGLFFINGEYAAFFIDNHFGIKYSSTTTIKIEDFGQTIILDNGIDTPFDLTSEELILTIDPNYVFQPANVEKTKLETLLNL